MSSTVDALPRLLALVPYLVERPGVDFATVARDFAITEDQVRKDLDLVIMCGTDKYYTDSLIEIDYEGDTITVHDPQGVDRPLRLTADEALALVVALRTLAETPGLAEPDAVLRALAKVEAAAGDAGAPADRVEIELEGEEAVLSAVRQAFELGRALRLTYWSAGRDATTERVVDPMQLVTVNGRSYLEAWCRLAEDVRTFHLGRVEEITVLETPSDPPKNVASRDPAGNELFAPSPEDTVVRLVLEPRASWVADYYPVEAVEPLDDGKVAVTLRAHETAWVRRLVLSLGAAARVVTPNALAEEVRAEARAALAGYGSAVG